MLRNSPTALRVLKSALNAAEDGQAGIQQLGGDATLLFYQSEEGNEVGASKLVAWVFVCVCVVVLVGEGGCSAGTQVGFPALRFRGTGLPALCSQLMQRRVRQAV